MASPSLPAGEPTQPRALPARSLSRLISGTACRPNAAPAVFSFVLMQNNRWGILPSGPGTKPRTHTCAAGLTVNCRLPG